MAGDLRLAAVAGEPVHRDVVPPVLAPVEAGPDAVPQDMRLPPLREDLRLHPGPSLPNGAPTWVIEDPARARFFRIGWLEFELLTRWQAGTARRVLTLVREQTPLQPEMDEVLAVRQFLLSNELSPNPQALARAEADEGPRQGLGTRLLHNYLMIRVPLWRPDRFLEAMLPLARPFLSSWAAWVSALAGLAGLYFAALQWDVFASTFLDTLTPSGFASYLAALCFAKVLHELGHAFTAKAHGLRVAHMGVAIILLFPMLYTDTGESWRLARHRHRFTIAAAGVRAELMLAAWSTLAWSFLPEGPLRSGAFFLATVSWVVTLGINASPFMRFDGYYMLSDAAGLPNLHDAGFAVMRQKLRRFLLGVESEEMLVAGDRLPAWVGWFGFTTLLYRAVVFTGIAVAVYQFFFKALGLFLFAVEIWWFLARPFWRELLVWWTLRGQVRTLVVARTALLLALVGVALAVPWPWQVRAEGWVRASQEQALYSPRPAALTAALREGDAVGSQDPVANLTSPDLDLRQARASARMEALDSRLQAFSPDRPAAGPVTEESSARSTRQQWQQQRQELGATVTEARQLELNAPFAGRLVDVEREVGRGTVVARTAPLARVVDTSRWIAEVFVDEEDVKRVRVSDPVMAYLDGVDDDVLTGRVEAADMVPVAALPHEMLAVQFGGRLATSASDSLAPQRPLYRLRVSLDGAPRTPQARLARFSIRGEPASVLDRLWRSALSSLVSQAGF